MREPHVCVANGLDRCEAVGGDPMKVTFDALYRGL